MGGGHGDRVGTGVDRDMVKEEWEQRWSGNKILVHECQAACGFCPWVRGLTEESDSERGHKQGMHTKESHFVFVFLLLPGLLSIL